MPSLDIQIPRALASSRIIHMTSTYLRPFASIRYGIQSHQEKKWKSICLLKIYNEKKMLHKKQPRGITIFAVLLPLDGPNSKI